MTKRIKLPEGTTLRSMTEGVEPFTLQNEALRKKISDLKNRQERFKNDPEFVERTAREMGMLKPNEVVFKFTNKTSNATQP